ncbi:cysteine-rich KTR domain-containing protein [Lachnospiraceae bacterium LCP25S3_G4]
MNTSPFLCPLCRSKTRLKLRADTELKNFLLFCPKCKKETLVDVKSLTTEIISTRSLI